MCSVYGATFDVVLMTSSESMVETVRDRVCESMIVYVCVCVRACERYAVSEWFSMSLLASNHECVNHQCDVS